MTRMLSSGQSGLNRPQQRRDQAMMKYRADIDGLRAVAVLPVVLFHAGLTLFSGGFVGVDVFFVISGFLITKIIIDDIEQGRYSVARFYERRIRRIMPAYLVTVTLTLVVALVLLLPDDLADLGSSALWSALMSSNVFFWIESRDYFNGAAELKPLLHTWSLSVEEQFYVLFPIVLLVLKWVRLWRFAALLCLLAALASFALSVYGVAYAPMATFYLLPTRAWELMVGSVLAFGLFPSFGGRAAGWESLVGLALILVPVFSYTPETAFPGLMALPPVLGAALVIHSGQGGQAAGPGAVAAWLLASAPLRFVGLISYSLYLVHWPIVVFMKYYYIEIDGYQRLLIVVMSVLLAALSWKYVEQPARRGQMNMPRPKLFAATAGAIALIAVAGWAVYDTGGLPGRVPDDVQLLASKKAHQGPWRECGSAFGAGKTIADLCVLGASGREPDFAILGDSHANAVSAAIFEAAAKVGRSGYQISDNGYRPMLEFTKFGEEQKYKYVNTLVKDLFATKPEIKDVIVAIYWRQAALVDGYYDSQGRFTDGVTAMQAGLPALVQRYPDKRFLFLLSTANSALFGANPAGRATWFGRSFDPVVDVAEFKRLTAAYAGVVAELGAEPNVRLLDLSSRICDAKFCHGLLGDKLAFTDDNHLSYAAAKLFEPDFAAFLTASDKPGVDGPSDKPVAAGSSSKPVAADWTTEPSGNP